AEYRYRIAWEKASPQAKWRRRLESLRKQIEAARAKAAEAERVGTATFDAAKRALAEGDEEFRQRHWSSARPTYRRALRVVEDAAASMKGGWRRPAPPDQEPVPRADGRGEPAEWTTVVGAPGATPGSGRNPLAESGELSPEVVAASSDRERRLGHYVLLD